MVCILRVDVVVLHPGVVRDAAGQSDRREAVLVSRSVPVDSAVGVVGSEPVRERFADSVFSEK